MKRDSLAFRYGLTLLAFFAGPVLAQEAGAGVDLSGEKQRTSYMVAMDISKGLQSIKDEIDIHTLALVLEDLMNGKTARIPEVEAKAMREAFTARLQKKKK